MGMSIDDSISHLSGILTEATEFTNSICYVTEDDAETLQVAIDTMRKYQQLRDKISTIYVGYRHGYEVMADVMEILREVEDGNVD